MFSFFLSLFLSSLLLYHKTGKKKYDLDVGVPRDISQATESLHNLCFITF